MSNSTPGVGRGEPEDKCWNTEGPDVDEEEEKKLGGKESNIVESGDDALSASLRFMLLLLEDAGVISVSIRLCSASEKLGEPVLRRFLVTSSVSEGARCCVVLWSSVIIIGGVSPEAISKPLSSLTTKRTLDNNKINTCTTNNG